MPAAAVVEVTPAVPLHALPDAPACVVGVFRFRGNVIPVLDLHRLSGNGSCPELLSTRIVVVRSPADGRMIGLLTELVVDLKPFVAVGDPFIPPNPLTGPTLGAMVTDADGVLRLPDVGTLTAWVCGLVGPPGRGSP